MIPSKTCAHCRAVKPLDDFKPNPRMNDGRSSWCKLCHNKATREWRAVHRDELNARRRVKEFSRTKTKRWNKPLR